MTTFKSRKSLFISGIFSTSIIILLYCNAPCLQCETGQALCESMGVGVKTHSSTLIEAQADRLRRRAERDGLTRPEQPEEPKVEKKKSDSLFVGETKVEEKGKAGQKEVEYQVKIVNGEEVEKEKKGEKVLSEPKAKVVVEGTKKKEKPTSPTTT